MMSPLLNELYNLLHSTRLLGFYKKVDTEIFYQHYCAMLHFKKTWTDNETIEMVDRSLRESSDVLTFSSTPMTYTTDLATHDLEQQHYHVTCLLHISSIHELIREIESMMK